MSKENKRRKRVDLSETEHRKVWVRAGGRCCLCKAYLLDGGLTWQEISIGVGAHIVGQAKSDRSPRGLDEMPLPERDTAENVLLACDSCHREIDHKLAVGLMTVEKLQQIKQEHEDFIRYVTDLAVDKRTVVLRVIGNLRGNAVELTQNTAAAAVLRSGDRFPSFPLSFGRHGVEIDLRQIPGEEAGSDSYYTAAKAKIDEVLAHRLNEGVLSDYVSHLSVFAFGRLPLLVYLGSRLDDTVPTQIYQRHRATESWEWEEGEDIITFGLSSEHDVRGTEEVLLLNLSGAVDLSEIPAALRGLRVHRIYPTEVTPHVDILRREASLRNFEGTLRRLLGTIEIQNKGCERLHVFPAVPISAGITLGRVHDEHVNPAFAVYDRQTDGTYRSILELTR